MARVLVTGAGGFVGSNLIKALTLRNDEVHAVVRPAGDLWRLKGLEKDITTHEVDLLVQEQLASVVERVSPDSVFHLAHYGGNSGQGDEAQTRKIIIDATAELYAACKRLKTVPRIVTTGSSSEYGTKQEAMREDMCPEPNTPYGCAKLWATLYGEHLRREEGMSITTLRLFSVYGPYEHSRRLIPAVTLAFLSGGTPTLAYPNTSRDFVHVADVVDALFCAERRGAPGVYNVGTGKNTTLAEMVALLQAETKSSAELAWGENEGRSFDTALWVADMTKTKDVLGWKPRISLADGVKETVAWFKEHKELYEGGK